MVEPQIVVLISGQGRNLQALIEAAAAGWLGARIAAVISNRPDAAGLERARSAGIPTQVVPHQDHAERAAFDAALAEAIETHQPQIVVLAGFMRVLGERFVGRFHGRLVNIHPSLLPKYPGLDTHRRALEAGETRHGATVHYVTSQLDGGPAIIQGELSTHAQDTPVVLASRVMERIELRIYPQAVAWMARGAIRLVDGQVQFHGRTLRKPLTLADLEPEFR
ncbi:MAG TPA: phosphoribosylglycinamide formyltransferase [Solimonas sp.]|nr:phosphoribosylglycinamide formyltransferase [Solimonas sp.]